MATRRQFIQAGFGAVMLGLLRRSGIAYPPPISIPSRGGPYAAPRPFERIAAHPESVSVGGYPFDPNWGGDSFAAADIPFHGVETHFPGGAPPPPSEEVDVVVVGGGLAGLTAAYLLRHHRPVLFELHDRFGGVAKGGIWQQIEFSLGSAYFIAPDEDTFLESFYSELGLDQVHALNEGTDLVEFSDKLLADFWTEGLSPGEAAAYARYAEIVAYFTEKYPEIPLPEKGDSQWILDLDVLNLKQDIEQRMGMPIPKSLASGIQAYCLSSFDASWDRVSAAAGWNFLAAEEFGRWVCPGGNAWVSDELWRRLSHSGSHGPAIGDDRLRAGHRVVQVRSSPQGRFNVIYRVPDGSFGAVSARRVVMCCSKHICKYLLPELPIIDIEHFDAMNNVLTHPYTVVNVLLDQPVDVGFYDVFLLGDGEYPIQDLSVSMNSFVADVLNGRYAEHGSTPHSVLTLYWPMAYTTAMFELVNPDSWQVFAEKLVPQLDRILPIFGVDRNHVRQVRMARWGHAMPVAQPGFIAYGTAAKLREPFMDHIYFANQDNWALPAFETSLLEAKHVADLVDASLR